MLPGSPELNAATDALRDRLGDRRPRVMLTLGSGLGDLADAVTDRLEIPFADVGLPDTTVPGHAGRFVSGTLAGVEVLVQQGRVHLYEGLGVDRVVAAVRAAAGVGVGTYVATNAAGGIVDTLNPGDLMVINDHINGSGQNALTGIVPPHFLDQSDAYRSDLRASFHAAAKEVDVTLREGVYVGLAGPTYETKAEVAMYRIVGGHAVGMSTVNEVIAANAAGMQVLGCSLITNVHRIGGTPTDHEEVMVEGRAAGPRLGRVITAWLPTLR
ncbi:Purine nucleoside phosphorylase [Euzebya pacifica]|uniref:Purine nucleoside phosphorylase n=1 Tax=Euzebya pacifica TaxID=1608957 RepID=A0A346XTZ6_9ACTN|nr:purine-nucleoside phosphorylase [Euzebya pacifica]AXV05693.1 Purine nucleoside phosphorylase [Euzebya pacifica]